MPHRLCLRAARLCKPPSRVFDTHTPMAAMEQLKALEQRVARMEKDEDFKSTQHMRPPPPASAGAGASSAEVSEVARAASARRASLFLFTRPRRPNARAPRSSKRRTSGSGEKTRR